MRPGDSRLPVPLRRPLLHGSGASLRLSSPDVRRRQRASQCDPGSHVAAVRRLFLFGAVPQGVSAVDPRPAADRRQRRAARLDAGGAGAARPPFPPPHSPRPGGRPPRDRAPDISMAVTDLLLVDQTEVAQLLPMDECMEVMARALASLARGQAQLPLRSILWLPERIGAFALMPGALHEDKIVGAKVVTFFYGNQGTD